MSESNNYKAPSRSTPETHLRSNDKLSRIPVRVEPQPVVLKKPAWIRTRLPSGNRVQEIKSILRDNQLHSVCEEAACPNLGECFNGGTATFMIMGDLCTRRCPFCDVAHGKPAPLDSEEPRRLASTIQQLRLNYVVITSVDRDDLRDGGAGHFAECIDAIRELCPETRIEILVPDFRGRLNKALLALSDSPPDVFNHNLETVPRLYRQARPGADYAVSLTLLKHFRRQHPAVPAKSGIMLGLGETIDEVRQLMQDLRDSDCEMLTLGQYLQPSRQHLPVVEYVQLETFDRLAADARDMGFTSVASGPMVRSSYHADEMANNRLS